MMKFRNLRIQTVRNCISIAGTTACLRPMWHCTAVFLKWRHAVVIFILFSSWCICVAHTVLYSCEDSLCYAVFCLLCKREVAAREKKKKKNVFVTLVRYPCGNCCQKGFFFLNGRYKRRDEERGLFFHTKQRAKIVNEDGGTASNSSCRKHFLSHSEELTRIGHPTIWKSGDWEGGQPHHRLIRYVFECIFYFNFFLKQVL